MRSKKGEIAITILKVVALAGFVVAVAALPGLGGVLRLFDAKSNEDRRKFRRSLQGLQKSKAIKYYRKDGKDVIEITEKGRKLLLSYNFENISIQKPKKWDGFFRVVIFDIPERKKLARDTFRMKLIDLGFKKIQDSVFILPFECRKEIEFLKNFLFIDPCVTYMLVKDIEGKDKIIKHFKL